ncbi:MAG: substrate-binding domain-containing protein, partial [Pelolinea sp.]|nr:substrate-binding domain-containing protein [Pelolinea sp.]
VNQKKKRKIMKRKILLITGLLLITIFVVTACQPAVVEEMAEEAAPVEEVNEEEVIEATQSYDCSDLKLAAIVHWQGPYTQQLIDGAIAAGEECGGEVQGAGPVAFDTTAQYAAFQDLVDSGADAIVTVGYPAEFWIKPIDEATNRGVAVSTFDVASTSSLQYIFAGPKESDLGRALADTIIEEIGADATGKIVTGLCLPGLDVISNRYVGFASVFAEKAPGVEVSQPYDVTFDNAENYAKWQEIITSKEPGAIAYVGFCENDMNNMAKIKEDNEGEYIIASVGINPESLAAVESGLGLVVVGQKPFMQGYVTMRAMIEGIVYNKPIPRGWVNVGPEIVTSENAATILAREESLSEGLDQTYQYYLPEIDEIFTDLESHVESYGDYLTQ